MTRALIVVVALVALSGCARFSFEESRLAGVRPHLKAAQQEDRTYCRRLDREHAILTGVAASAGALAATSGGLTSIPSESTTARDALAGSAVGLGAVAAGAAVWAAADAATWSRECSQ